MNSDGVHWTDPVAYLRQALAQDQFTLYCQPIAALAGAVAYPMAEVLVRLCEEEKALLPPGEFLPVLEHYGIMPELDRWVLRRVLRKLSAGSQIPRFTVNLSGQTIADPTFPDFFANEILVSDVPADRVLFEIDESDAVALPQCIARFSATIGSLGSGVVIDGFGRAQDYLASLKVPCVQFIKVHGSLTRQLAAGEIPAKLSAILRVTAGVGVHLIMECVEDPELLVRLKAMKIQYAQGFGVCAPCAIDLVSEVPVIRFNEHAQGSNVDATTADAFFGIGIQRWAPNAAIPAT